MQSSDLEMEDELRPEYDLKSMRVKKLGGGRRSFASTIVQLDPDVAAMFPNVSAVNEEQSNTVLETIDKS